MKRIFSNIIVYSGQKGAAKLQLPYVHSIEISTSRNNYTDTCTIQLPQKMGKVGRRLTDSIQIGDKVEVKYGYGKVITEFIGYVTGVDVKFNAIITLEDDAWLYKLYALGKDYKLKDTTFNTLISTIYKGQFKTTDDKIGDWNISKNATLLDILDELKKTFDTISYWQNGILYVNYEFEKSENKRIRCEIRKNILTDTSTINKSKSNDVGVVSKGTSPQKDGTVIEVYSYYKDVVTREIVSQITSPVGNISDFQVPGLSREDLQKLTERRLPKLYSQSISGEVTTYGEPSIQHGDAMEYIDNDNSDNNGVYEVVEIIKTLSVDNGLRQTIKIGEKIANIN